MMIVSLSRIYLKNRRKNSMKVGSKRVARKNPVFIKKEPVPSLSSNLRKLAS